MYTVGDAYEAFGLGKRSGVSMIDTMWKCQCISPGCGQFECKLINGFILRDMYVLTFASINILTTTGEVEVPKTYPHIEVSQRAYAQGSIQAAVDEFEQTGSVKGGLNCIECGEMGLATRSMHVLPLFVVFNAAPSAPGSFHKHNSLATVDNDIVLFGHAYTARMMIYYGSAHFATLLLTGEGGSCKNSLTISHGILNYLFS